MRHLILFCFLLLPTLGYSAVDNLIVHRCPDPKYINDTAYMCTTNGKDNKVKWEFTYTENSKILYYSGYHINKKLQQKACEARRYKIGKLWGVRLNGQSVICKYTHGFLSNIGGINMLSRFANQTSDECTTKEQECRPKLDGSGCDFVFCPMKR